jgi:hypothetical protein
MSRRRFIKSITGMLVATAIPKPLLVAEEVTNKKESFYEMAQRKHAKRIMDQLEERQWGTKGQERMRIKSDGTFYVNYDKL